MFPFSRTLIVVIALAFCLFSPATARAESTILSGMFDGAEPTVDMPSGYGCPQDPLGYRLSTFRVSASGTYLFRDAFEQIHRHGGVPVTFSVYEGRFDPSAPGMNRKRGTLAGHYSLAAGVNYVLFLQHGLFLRHDCENVEGAWAMAIVGPGTVNSADAAEVPGFTRGRFTASDPAKPWNPWSDELTAYRQSGPIRVSRSGTYYFSDLLVDAQVSLQVYREPVNPADPWANLVAAAAYGSPLIELQAGQDYYFVAQRIGERPLGEYLFVLAPPASFRINPALSGSWHNPETPGQGFFLSAFENINQVFLSWFTWADDPLAGDEFGHRWMTAFGSYAGTSAELAMEWTTGGRFDAAHPEPEQNLDGSIQLEFTDCATGQISYGWGLDEFGSPSVSGVIPIRRLANDSVLLCESLYAGPGMPGPL